MKNIVVSKYLTFDLNNFNYIMAESVILTLVFFKGMPSVKSLQKQLRQNEIIQELENFQFSKLNLIGFDQKQSYF